METKTQRSYKNVETDVFYDLYMDNDKHNYSLIDKQGNRVNGFYLCPFDSVQIKLNTKQIISLSYGEFYNLKEGETVTHRKFCGFKKFTKI